MNNENEPTAALLTIEKCRELSGCPAGVDLQDWVNQLAAENVWLAAEYKMAVDAVTVFSNVTHDVTEIICDELGHDRVAEIVAAYNDLGNMTTTDRILAEAEARGLKKAKEIVRQCHDNICPGGLAENRQYEEAMVQPYLDCISDELDLEIEQLREEASHD